MHSSQMHDLKVMEERDMGYHFNCPFNNSSFYYKAAFIPVSRKNIFSSPLQFTDSLSFYPQQTNIFSLDFCYLWNFPSNRYFYKYYSHSPHVYMHMLYVLCITCVCVLSICIMSACVLWSRWRNKINTILFDNFLRVSM